MLPIAELLHAAPLLAQAGGGDTFAFSWGLVLFCVFMGVSVALLPARRSTEFKRTKDE